MPTTPPIITVFGGSRCRPGEAEYHEALLLGRLLAARGLTVACGGYSGVMEAVSRGAREAGGEVVGMTLAPFGKSANPFVTRERPSQDLYERLRRLIHESEGFIAVRGGLGTVAEVVVVWNQFLLGTLPPRPLVLLGDCWPPVIESWKKHLVVGPRDLKWVQLASSPEDAVARVSQPLPGGYR